MAGEWIYRKVDQHSCQRPVDSRAQVGDVWKCECGRKWRVTGLTWHCQGCGTVISWEETV